MLSFHGFNTIDCLVPLSKRLHHLFSLTELNLDQLLTDECKLCSFLESLRFIPCLQFKYWGSKYHRLLHNGSQQTWLFHTNFPHTTKSEGCMRDPSVCKGVWVFPSRNAFVRNLGDNRDRWHSASRGYGGTVWWVYQNNAFALPNF